LVIADEPVICVQRQGFIRINSSYSKQLRSFIINEMEA
jgi:hypothetical protein